MNLGVLLPILVWGIPFVGLAWLGVVSRRWLHRSIRRSPFTKAFLRSPGHSLQEQLDDLRIDLPLLVALGGSAAPLCYGVYMQMAQASPHRAHDLALFTTLIGLAVIAWCAWRIFHTIRRARDLRLGYEAERAVGEELNQLMREGYFVFHDVPGDKEFNVDHVVAGRSGVYAVETKGRSKPSQNRDSGHKVQYDGQKLLFPGWAESAPLEQATRNAQWLEKWLSSAVGEPVSASPVVMLPGWYVDRTSGGGIPVLNEKGSRAYFTKIRGRELSAKLLQQIAHQLEQRCRDVEPRAYRPVE